MRARSIKPGFFENDTLGELDCSVRLLFIGLWCLADREGRLEDRPKKIKGLVFPYDSFEVDSMLGQLESGGFIVRYEVDSRRFIEIINFVKHQDPHYRERASLIPPAPGSENKIVATGVTRTQRARILDRDGYKCNECGTSEQLCIDHVLPVSMGGDSSDENLQTLCLSCNTKKGNRIAAAHAPTSNPTRINIDSTQEPSDPLTPDSLTPDSLTPDSLTPDSLTPDSLTPDSPTPDSPTQEGCVSLQDTLSGSPDEPRAETEPGRVERIPYTEIVDRLNERAGKGFRADNKETRKLIKARWREGFRLTDFETVIAVKCGQWLYDPERMGYLRPETLFGRKFESYLNEARASPPPREPTPKMFGKAGIAAMDAIRTAKGMM